VIFTSTRTEQLWVLILMIFTSTRIEQLWVAELLSLGTGEDPQYSTQNCSARVLVKIPSVKSRVVQSAFNNI
jgi:hypothetical protein